MSAPMSALAMENNLIRSTPAGSQVVGLTSPEFLSFAKRTIAAIWPLSRRLLGKMAASVKTVPAFLKRQTVEGAEIYNRAAISRDELHSKSWYLRRDMM